EPHFKDYKSAAFALLDSGLQDAQALTCLVRLLACASLIALVLGMLLVCCGQRPRLDWHGQRGLSFLQLGLRAVLEDFALFTSGKVSNLSDVQRKACVLLSPGNPKSLIMRPTITEPSAETAVAPETAVFSGMPLSA
ncbi:MAG: hypothetical protein ACFB8W_10720, partial [Elainellaceae cyanobacterium]